MRTIKLMADYDCWPLWGVGRDDVGNIDPSGLRLSSNIQRRLARWASSYDATLNRNDPTKSGFATADAKAAFVEEGYSLGEELQAELEPISGDRQSSLKSALHQTPVSHISRFLRTPRALSDAQSTK